jgi:hypothetical protein
MAKKIVVDFTIRANIDVEDNWKDQLLRLQNILNNIDFTLSSSKIQLNNSWLEKIQIRELKEE